MKTYLKFDHQKVERVNGIEEFKDLSAKQIKERVANMKTNAADLAALITQPKYTAKLSALPDLMPEEMYLKSVQISYPMANKAGNPKNSLVVSGVIHSLDGHQVELNEGGKFRNKVDDAKSMRDLCKTNVKMDYPANDKSLILGTLFTMKCEKS